MKTYKVKNGSVTYEFDGTLLAESTSQKPDGTRWVEFRIYVTVAGTYILERVGRSDVFHDLSCEVVERNGLRFDPRDVLEDRHVPCLECDPDEFQDLLVLEKDRYFALTSEDPKTIIKSLYRKDGDSFYMTKVTERLIEDASKVDKRLEQAYKVQYIA